MQECVEQNWVIFSCRTQKYMNNTMNPMLAISCDTSVYRLIARLSCRINLFYLTKVKVKFLDRQMP